MKHFDDLKTKKEIMKWFFQLMVEYANGNIKFEGRGKIKLVNTKVINFKTGEIKKYGKS